MMGSAAFLASYLLLALAGLLAIPVVVLLAETIAATLRPRWRPPPLPSEEGLRPTVAVLVPAHNEGKGLLPTVADIRAQLAEGDRLVVVADNCSDDTAAVARAAGAEVTERHDPDKRGKGYALDWGIQHLSPAPPSVVIIIDADCRLGDATIKELTRAADATARPVQALDLMTAPKQSAIDPKVVAEFAWRVKNWVRPLGLDAFKLPCQLMGTGMAFPWSIIGSARLASGHIVEDLKLGLDLAMAGHPPLFWPTAIVTSQFPSSAEAAARQRERWEHGYVATSLATVPGLIAAALRRGNLALLALALDLLVPPLTLLGMLAAAMLVLTTVTAMLGYPAGAFWVSLVNLGGFLLAVVLAWTRFGRDILPAAALASVPAFIWAKLPIYGRFLRRGPTTQWRRTDRK
jgi:cellulose synthase/poly-beta-1,6-N-acetylglucosamine synthase-like glycosyltransferase